MLPRVFSRPSLLKERNMCRGADIVVYIHVNKKKPHHKMLGGSDDEATTTSTTATLSAKRTMRKVERRGGQLLI